VWHVILPAARAGIIGATVLALGRALAETVAVAMVIGNRPEIPHSVFSPGYTLAAVIANEFAEATGDIYQGALVEIGLVLILVTLTVNLLALLLVHSARARALV
jgi:phosphate transport system permease protein